jgi:RNA polymerase II subunit A C-terminal domain phosphatase SSU72
VRLPVPGTSGEGRSFEFGTPYERIRADLAADVKNEAFYQKTRLLDILKRDSHLKVAPERWQDADYDTISKYNVVICFEQRIFDAVTEGGSPTLKRAS